MIPFLSFLFVRGVGSTDSFYYNKWEDTGQSYENISNYDQNLVGECAIKLYGNPGFFQYHENFDSSRYICINITTFRFFLVWNNYPLDTEVIYYKSIPGDSTLIKANVSYAPNLPLFSEISNPFASVTIKIPSGGYVDFSYGSVPSMCKTGLVITNGLEYKNTFSYQKTDSISKLDYFEDKCILFSSRGSLNVSFRSNFDGVSQRILTYQNIISPQVIKDYSYSFINYDLLSQPLIIRILTQKKESELTVEMTSDGLHPTLVETGFFDTEFVNNCPDEECNLWVFVQPDIFAVYLAFFIVLFIVILVTIYVLFLWKCPEKVGSSPRVDGLDSTPFASTSALLEARTEPAGYFAVDHHIDDQPN